MGIRERGYAHWEGSLQESRFSWWPITRQGINLAFQQRFFKLFFFLALFPALFFIVGIYVSERLEDFRHMIRGPAGFLEVNPSYFKAYFTNDFFLFMLVMVVVFAGAGLISDDLRHNALQLYFSRPLKKSDYLLGKATVLVFFLSLLTFLPGILFILIKIIFSGSFKFLRNYPSLIGSVLGFSTLLTTFFSFYALFLSSVGKNRRYSGIFIFSLYFFPDVLFGVLYSIFRNPYLSLLSIKANLQQIGAYIFTQKAPYPISCFYSLLIILAILFSSAIALGKRIRGVEVVK